MFSSSEQLTRVTHELVIRQSALVSHSAASLVDAALRVAEPNVETIRTNLASSTVATRQWLGAGGAHDWLSPVAHQSHLGWAHLPALPLARAHPAAPALEWRLD